MGMSEQRTRYGVNPDGSLSPCRARPENIGTHGCHHESHAMLTRAEYQERMETACRSVATPLNMSHSIAHTRGPASNTANAGETIALGAAIADRLRLDDAVDADDEARMIARWIRSDLHTGLDGIDVYGRYASAARGAADLIPRAAMGDDPLVVEGMTAINMKALGARMDNDRLTTGIHILGRALVPQQQEVASPSWARPGDMIVDADEIVDEDTVGVPVGIVNDDGQARRAYVTRDSWTARRQRDGTTIVRESKSPRGRLITSDGDEISVDTSTWRVYDVIDRIPVNGSTILVHGRGEQTMTHELMHRVVARAPWILEESRVMLPSVRTDADDYMVSDVDELAPEAIARLLHPDGSDGGVHGRENSRLRNWCLGVLFRVDGE